MGLTSITASAAITLAIGLVACSSSSGGNDSCGQVAPCGGNIVGTWKIVDECVDGDLVGANSACPAETFGVQSITASGTFTFNADGTYALTDTISASASVTIPTSCLSDGGVTVSCAELPSSTIGAGSPAGTTCTTSGSDCVCTVGQTMSDTENGTYTISGTSVTHTSTSSSAGTVGSVTSSYCVQGNTLHLLGGGADAGGASSDLVATKEQ